MAQTIAIDEISQLLYRAQAGQAGLACHTRRASLTSTLAKDGVDPPLWRAPLRLASCAFSTGCAYGP
jgi:hypothetical protein